MEECKELSLLEFLDPNNSFAFGGYNANNQLISLNSVDLIKIEGAFNEELIIRIKLNDHTKDNTYVDKFILLDNISVASVNNKINLKRDKISFTPQNNSLFYYYILTFLKLIVKDQLDELVSFKFLKITK